MELKSPLEPLDIGLYMQKCHEESLLLRLGKLDENGMAKAALRLNGEKNGQKCKNNYGET